MSDEPVVESTDIKPRGMYAEKLERDIARGQAMAKEFLTKSVKCDRCHKPIATRGRHRHLMCEKNSTIAKACVCVDGCTKHRYGDVGICDPDCVPCKVWRGDPYKANRKPWE